MMLTTLFWIGYAVCGIITGGLVAHLIPDDEEFGPGEWTFMVVVCVACAIIWWFIGAIVLIGYLWFRPFRHGILAQWHHRDYAEIKDEKETKKRLKKLEKDLKRERRL